MSDNLTHFNEQGRARMVDVSGKESTKRSATARTTVSMMASTLERIKSGNIGKGDVLAVAQVAAFWLPRRRPSGSRCVIRCRLRESISAFPITGRMRFTLKEP